MDIRLRSFSNPGTLCVLLENIALPLPPREDRTEPAVAPETTPPSPEPLLGFAFSSSHFVSENLGRTPHAPSSQSILSPFLKAILRMC